MSARTTFLFTTCLLTAGVALAQTRQPLPSSVLDPRTLPPFDSSAVPPGPVFQRDTRPIQEIDQDPMSFGALADDILPSTVTIRLAGRPDGAALPAGAGVIISVEGHILTAARIVGSARTVEINLPGEGDSRSVIGRVLAADTASDIAVVKVDGMRLAPIALGDSTQVRAGSRAFIAPTSRSFAKVKITAVSTYLESDEPVDSGSAGSPMVDAAGRLIGLNVSPPRGETAGLAIPINIALPLLESLNAPPPVASTAPAPVPTIGGQRAFLGVQIADVPPPPSAPGVPSIPRGAAVQMIGAGSPAERAGMEIGDVIVAIDRQPVAEGARLRQILSALAPGTEITIDVLREGRTLSLKTVLTEVPTEAAAVTGVPPPSFPTPPVPGPTVPVPSVESPAAPLTSPAPVDVTPAEMLSGLTTVALTPEVRARHAVPVEMTGVLVTQLAPTSRAAAMGLQEGDVILQVNRKPVTSPAEARNFALQGDKTVLLKIFRKGDTMVFMVGRE